MEQTLMDSSLSRLNRNQLNCYSTWVSMMMLVMMVASALFDRFVNCWVSRLLGFLVGTDYHKGFIRKSM